MFHQIVSATVTIPVAIGLCWGAAQAVADDGEPAIGRPHLTTGAGAKTTSLQPRGECFDEIFAGDPTCIPNANTLSVGISPGGRQECGDGQWVSLAYPVVTSGETIIGINIIHNINPGSGDLYLMGDCGGNPDVNNILYVGCECIEGAVGGEVTNYCIGDPIAAPPAIVWVVAVRRGDVDFDIAFDCLQDGPGHGYGNLVGSGDCGDWQDLDDFPHGNDCNPGGTLGGCAWVSLVVPAPGLPHCCISAAQCDGDVNGDGYVDPLDTGAILGRYGLDGSNPANCPYDVNCDGLIDPLDSGYVLARFGTCTEPVACPLGGGTPGECDGGDCPGSCGGPCDQPVADCCEIHIEPGCDTVCGAPDDGGVEQCVCSFDDFCCTVTWDSACVDLVESLSCADCSETNPDCVE